MFKLDNDFLTSMSLGGLPVDEKNRLLQMIYERLEMNVGMRLAEKMTDQQLDEFEGFIDRNDEAGALKWLESNFPNYKDVVAEELEKLKGEVQAAAPQILAASQVTNSQQGQQPGMPPMGQAPQMPGAQPMGQPASMPGPNPMQSGFQSQQPMQPQPSPYGAAPQPGFGPSPMPQPQPQQPAFGQPQPMPQYGQPAPQPGSFGQGLSPMPPAFGPAPQPAPNQPVPGQPAPGFQPQPSPTPPPASPQQPGQQFTPPPADFTPGQ